MDTKNGDVVALVALHVVLRCAVLESDQYTKETLSYNKVTGENII